MITGCFYLKNYEYWKIRYFIFTSKKDAPAILDRLYSLGCSYTFLNKAKRLLYSGRVNTGITYSNPDKLSSVIIISKTTDVWEFLNSFAHEIDHLEKHISQKLGFSPYSENASYLVGEIIREMSYTIVKNI